MKKIVTIQKPRSNHWVGNGFPVRNMFGYNDLGKKISPFLLLDYAGPHEFPPSSGQKGVSEHPHRGFETVTIIYSGEVTHRDSSGSTGTVGPGDVQWMTAGAGVLHEEMHSETFQKAGGLFEVIQLWVNLRAKDKSLRPRYQTLLESDIPTVDLPNQAGKLRIIAGEYCGKKGPAVTQTPVNLWDIRLKAGQPVELTVPENHTAVLFCLSGRCKTDDNQQFGEVELAVFDSAGSTIALTAETDSKLLFMGGEPLGEPMVGLGPFVMNTREEITQAFLGYDAGTMGRYE